MLQLGKTLKTNPILSIYSPAAGVVQNKAMQPAQGQMGVTMPAQSQQELGVKVGMYITKGETVFKLLNLLKRYIHCRFSNSKTNSIPSTLLPLDRIVSAI